MWMRFSVRFRVRFQVRSSFDPQCGYKTAHKIEHKIARYIARVYSVGMSVWEVHISATRWPINCCPPEKEGNITEPYKVALKMSNFGIHFWPRVTLMTLLKYWNRGYLTWRFQFWGWKILNIVECWLHIQPPCGIIRTTVQLTISFGCVNGHNSVSETK